MKKRFFFSVLFLVILVTAHAGFSHPFLFVSQEDPGIETYYRVFKEGDLTAINQELAGIADKPGLPGQAYRGALLMRKAGLLQKAHEKLACFKSGRVELETAIRTDSNIAEFRFLRLMIQEHAPKVTKYHNELESDVAFIRQHFKSLPALQQRIVRDYSKTSTVLHPADL